MHYSLYYIFYCKNNIVCIMMSSRFSLISIQATDKLNLEVLKFRVFSELAIFVWFSTYPFKYFLCVRIFKGVGILMRMYYLIMYAEYLQVKIVYFSLPKY